MNLPGLSGRQGKKVVQDAQHWKKVHSLTENLYAGYLSLYICMVHCEEALDSRDLNKVDKHKVQAQTCLTTLKRQIEKFESELKELPKSLSQTKLILTLRKIPLCTDAIKQSMGTVPNSTDFHNGLILAKKVNDWLLDALHIADQILEAYFRETNGGIK